jgi:hypothetical protein
VDQPGPALGGENKKAQSKKLKAQSNASKK